MLAQWASWRVGLGVVGGLDELERVPLHRADMPVFLVLSVAPLALDEVRGPVVLLGFGPGLLVCLTLQLHRGPPLFLRSIRHGRRASQ